MALGHFCARLTCCAWVLFWMESDVYKKDEKKTELQSQYGNLLLLFEFFSEGCKFHIPS